VIDQPRISRELGESDCDPKEEKSPEQCVAPDDHKADEQTVVDNIERRARAPVRPRRERQQRNGNDIDDNRRDDDAKAFELKHRIGCRLHGYAAHVADRVGPRQCSQPQEQFSSHRKAS
jgi:hypothetical protein